IAAVDIRHAASTIPFAKWRMALSSSRLLEIRDRSVHFEPAAVRNRDRSMTVSSPLRHQMRRTANDNSSHISARMTRR
ncbi:hypothetical protein AAB984_38975, partial [Burkholderia contaminans]|uniref:hypothetical protein n=1 Tax=Burkholderia contaminans TaxID=488447 RepID=UPI003112CD3A